MFSTGISISKALLSLTRTFAANVNVTVVRMANEAVSPALQLTVEFVEHDPADCGDSQRQCSMRLLSSGESGLPCGVPSTPGLTSPFSITPAFRNAPNELQQPLVLDALGDLAHLFVTIDWIEKFFQIEVDHPSVALRDILLRLSHGVMRRSMRSEPIAVLGECRVPSPLQSLHYCLLDNFYPPHRFWFVGPVQQLLPNGQPVLLQIVAKLVDRHPVDARATFIAPHLLQCFLQVCSLTYFLHNSTRVG